MSTSQFDELARLYEDLSAQPWRRHLEIPSVLAAAGDLTGLAVLDLGCGSGVYTRLLRDGGARRVVGIDESAGMIAYAAAREREERRGIEYVAGALPAAEHGAFDLVLGVYVLPYANTAAELRSLCAQAAAALRPGGRFVTLPVHPDYSTDPGHYARYGFRVYSDRPREDAEPLTLELRFGDHDATVTARFWTPETLVATLHDVGFTSVTEHGYSVTAEGMAEQGEEFWHNYLTRPHAMILDSRA
jgi:SAM-dependent methyltransferase